MTPSPIYKNIFCSLSKYLYYKELIEFYPAGLLLIGAKRKGGEDYIIKE